MQNGDGWRIAGTGGTTDAVIRTSLPVTHIDDEIGTIRIRIALGGLLVALLAAGVSLLVSRRISRPKPCFTAPNRSFC